MGSFFTSRIIEGSRKGFSRSLDDFPSVLPVSLPYNRTQVPAEPVKKEIRTMRDVSNRRRFLHNCGWLAAGAAGGWLLPRWFSDAESARADEKNGSSAEEQIRKLKLNLPPVGKSGPTLVPAVRAGDMLYVSGHGPRKPDGTSVVGKLGKDLDVKQGQEAARLVGLQTLSVVRAELGSLDKVVRLVKTLGMVNGTPEYTQQPQVINGFSDLMVEVFGAKAGKGARSAVGMGSLPGGIAVEIEAIFQVRG
jgi:enamine deaminase RidA (YjgF/YER057c/UK114 family)